MKFVNISPDIFLSFYLIIHKRMEWLVMLCCRSISIRLPYQFSLGLCPVIPSFCFMDKGTGQTCAFLLPHRADGGTLLVPCHYRLILLSGSRFHLLPADISEHFLRIVALFLLGKRMNQGQYLLTDDDERLHLPEWSFLPRFQVMV